MSSRMQNLSYIPDCDTLTGRMSHLHPNILLLLQDRYVLGFQTHWCMLTFHISLCFILTLWSMHLTANPIGLPETLFVQTSKCVVVKNEHYKPCVCTYKPIKCNVKPTLGPTCRYAFQNPIKHTYK